MDLTLAGKVALVTGASAGIGNGIAQTFAEEGAKLAVVARRERRLKDLSRTIVENGGTEPVICSIDLTDDNAAESVHRRVLDNFENVDILVNAAGGSRRIDLEATEAEWSEGMDLNFTAARRLTHAFLPEMRERQWGRIINITGSSEPGGLNAATPAKAAMHAWAKSLSREVGPDNITVNSVSPGRILSEQITERLYPTEFDREQFAADNIPLGYFGDPEDIANAVVFLGSNKARYITGEIIHVDGGKRRFAF